MPTYPEKKQEPGLSWSGLTLLTRKLLRKLYSKRTLISFTYDLSQGHRPIKESSRFEYKHFEARDLESCNLYMKKYSKDFASFLKQGYVGFACVEKASGAIVASVWYAHDNFWDDFYGCKVELADDQVFQMAGETAEPFRNGLATTGTMFYAWRHWMNQPDTREIVAVVQDDNLPSLKYVHSVGFKEQKRMIVIHRILGIRFAQYRDYQSELFTHLHRSNRRKTASNASADAEPEGSVIPLPDVSVVAALQTSTDTTKLAG